MSTFGGLMKEYKLISLDRFDGINLESTLYMLSHNHSDHTVGLSSSEFQYRLQSNEMIKLYCSHITRDLLILDERYEPLSSSVVALDINCPQLIDIPDRNLSKVKEQVTVTLLQAGHCPGSVMFLVEGNEGTVLYTGDFRLSTQDFVDFEHLKLGTKVKEVQSVYIDTTFCVPQAMFIPSREDTTTAAVDLIYDWLSRSDGNHIVHLRYRADLGYENLFVRFSLEFNMQVHVDEDRYERYSMLGDMLNFVTTDGSTTQLHACRHPCRQVFGAAQRGLVRTLLFSTMCFLYKVSLDVYTICISDTFYRVCYSFHSSYSEVRDALFYLKPKRAFPNVIPRYQDKADAEKMQQRLNEFVNLAQLCHDPSASLTYHQLGQLKQPKSRKRKRHRVDRHSPLQLTFGDADTQQTSPTSKRRRVVTDSIHCLADLREQSTQSSAIPSPKDKPPQKFRLLFGGSSEDLSQQLSPAGGNHVDNADSAVTSETESSGTSDTSLSEDEIGKEEDLMTKADEEAMKIYVPLSASALSYISDDDEDNILDLFLKPPSSQLTVTTANCPTQQSEPTCSNFSVLAASVTNCDYDVGDKSSTVLLNEQSTDSYKELIDLMFFTQKRTSVSHKVDINNRKSTVPDNSVVLNEGSSCITNDDSYLLPSTDGVGSLLVTDTRSTVAEGIQGAHSVVQSYSQGSDDFRTPASQNSSHHSVVVVDGDVTSRSVGSQPLDSDSTIDIGCSPAKDHLHTSPTQFASDATTTDGWCTPCKNSVPDVVCSRSPFQRLANVGNCTSPLRLSNNRSVISREKLFSELNAGSQKSYTNCTSSRSVVPEAISSQNPCLESTDQPSELPSSSESVQLVQLCQNLTSSTSECQDVYDADVDSDCDDVISLCIGVRHRRRSAGQRLRSRSTLADTVVVSSDSDESPQLLKSRDHDCDQSQPPWTSHDQSCHGVGRVDVTTVSSGSESDDSVLAECNDTRCQNDFKTCAIAAEGSPVLFSESST